MLCPNCGTKTTTEHKFCRNCGMNLEPVSRALAAHLSGGGAAAGQLARATEQRALRRMTNGLLAGIVVIIFGLLLMAFLPGKAFKFLGTASAIIGVVAALMSVLSPLRTMGGGGAQPTPQALDDAAPNTGRLLHEQTFEHVPTSVTDHTTELLHVESKDREPRD
ncbi:MAG: zinc-ribbon domain-containing protein [Pyrinomonadaceae bacterium]